jgi:hypothetical protein
MNPDAVDSLQIAEDVILQLGVVLYVTGANVPASPKRI